MDGLPPSDCECCFVVNMPVPRFTTGAFQSSAEVPRRLFFCGLWPWVRALGAPSRFMNHGPGARRRAVSHYQPEPDSECQWHRDHPGGRLQRLGVMAHDSDATRARPGNPNLKCPGVPIWPGNGEGPPFPDSAPGNPGPGPGPELGDPRFKFPIRPELPESS
jgi:hypothetical protein